MRNHISAAQLAANRANAQKSTGPTSEAGKAASSQNRTTYGFTGTFILLEDEDEKEYLDLRESLIQEHQPATETERILVTKMAEHYWMTDRALHFQANCFRKENFFAFEKQVSLFMRYHIMHDRAFHRALTELRKCQKERREKELGIPQLKARALEVGLIYQASKIDVNHSKAQQIKAKTAQIVFESKKPNQSNLETEPGSVSDPKLGFESQKSTMKEQPAAA